MNSLSLKERGLELLRKAVGSPAAVFHSGQWEAVEALLRRERLLVVERTGWGKSIVYFLATRLLREQGSGCTLLISPLLSLMRNQIEAAKRIQVHAETINSTNQEEWRRVLAELRTNKVDILLISPERLASDEFLNRYLLPMASRIGLLVVDEAHCISDWGHDFRPDYRRIVRVLKALPSNIPVLATTATANARVVDDIEHQLGPGLNVTRGPLARNSLALQNLRMPSAAARMAWLAHVVPRLPGSGVIYTLTVRDALIISEWLQSRGIDAHAYHGGLQEGRAELENLLLQNKVKALVATVALGMGFDKPDLGFVIHFQRPGSVIHYYQQVGRAGRAIDSAYGILLSGAEDDQIANFFIRTAFPSEEEVSQILAVLREAKGPLKRADLQQRLNLSGGKLDDALKFLSLESPAPIQKTEQGYVRNPVRWTMPVERIERLTNLRREEQRQMQEYMVTRECLMQFLAGALGDTAGARCGKCANCAGVHFDGNIPPGLGEAAAAFLNQLELGIEPRRAWPPIVGFEGITGKIQKEFQCQTGRAMCRWGDPGIGAMVRTGKQQAGRFADELVKRAVELVQNRWKPYPPPRWVTCVPSLRHVSLVQDFASRLADALRLPFVACVRKIRETEPQKTRQNSVQQAQNLKQVFEINTRLVNSSPVLLVDDIVDSKWTFTVVGFKLLQAGSGPVFPFALADSSAGDGD